PCQLDRVAAAYGYLGIAVVGSAGRVVAQTRGAGAPEQVAEAAQAALTAGGGRGGGAGGRRGPGGAGAARRGGAHDGAGTRPLSTAHRGDGAHAHRRGAALPDRGQSARLPLRAAIIRRGAASG